MVQVVACRAPSQRCSDERDSRRYSCLCAFVGVLFALLLHSSLWALLAAATASLLVAWWILGPQLASKVFFPGSMIQQIAHVRDDLLVVAMGSGGLADGHINRTMLCKIAQQPAAAGAEFSEYALTFDERRSAERVRNARIHITDLVCPFLLKALSTWAAPSGSSLIVGAVGRIVHVYEFTEGRVGLVSLFPLPDPKSAVWKTYVNAHFVVVLCENGTVYYLQHGDGNGSLRRSLTLISQERYDNVRDAYLDGDRMLLLHVGKGTPEILQVCLRPTLEPTRSSMLNYGLHQQVLYQQLETVLSFSHQTYKCEVPSGVSPRVLRVLGGQKAIIGAVVGRKSLLGQRSLEQGKGACTWSTLSFEGLSQFAFAPKLVVCATRSSIALVNAATLAVVSQTSRLEPKFPVNSVCVMPNGFVVSSSLADEIIVTVAEPYALWRNLTMKDILTTLWMCCRATLITKALKLVVC